MSRKANSYLAVFKGLFVVAREGIESTTRGFSGPDLFLQKNDMLHVLLHFYSVFLTKWDARYTVSKTS